MFYLIFYDFWITCLGIELQLRIKSILRLRPHDHAFQRERLQTHRIKRKEVYKPIIFSKVSSLNVISDNITWAKNLLVTEWLSEWVSEWLSEWVTEWVSEWVKDKQIHRGASLLKTYECPRNLNPIFIVTYHMGQDFLDRLYILCWS